MLRGNAAWRCAGGGAPEGGYRNPAPGNPQAIWAFAGYFCAIKDWHSLVADCKESQEGNDTFRTLMLKDGGTIKREADG